MTRPLVQINTKADWYGGEYQVLKLVAGLHALGHETLLLANESGALYRRARDARLPVRPLPGLVCRKWCPFGHLVVGRLLSGFNPALVHAHDSRALRLAPRPDRPLPIVLARRVPSPFRHSPLSKRRHSARGVDAIIAVSNAVKDVLVASGVPGHRVHVVPSGTDIRELDAALPDRSMRELAGGRLCLGGIGALTTKKNWAMLVRVAAGVKRRGLDVRWFVAGDGPERARLEQLARKLGVSGDVRLVGFRDDAESFTKGLDILMHASRAEGTPGAVRMAMLAGVPVVAVNTRGTLEALGDCGLTVGLDDDEAAAAAVERLASDGALRKRLAVEASATARDRFDIGAMVEGTLRVYETVLGGAAGWQPNRT